MRRERSRGEEKQETRIQKEARRQEDEGSHEPDLFVEASGSRGVGVPFFKRLGGAQFFELQDKGSATDCGMFMYCTVYLLLPVPGLDKEGLG